MNEPNRLADASDDELARLLLRAGRARAPEAARERALAAASAVVATGLATNTAAASAIAAKAGAAATLKWIGIGVAVVAVAGAGVVARRALRGPPAYGEAPSQVPAGGRTTSAAPRRVSLPPRPEEQLAPYTGAGPSPATVGTGPTVPATRPGTPATAAPAAKALSGAAMAEELAWLERARTATTGGDPARGLSLLDAYGVRFPHGMMAPEATMLRIEALIGAGDRPAAERA